MSHRLSFSKLIKWLLMSVMIVSFTACTSSSNNDELTAHQVAIAKIMKYAETGTPVPTVQDYADAEVKGVAADNIDVVNAVVAELTPEDVNTTEKIQAIVDGLGIALPPPDTTAPTLAEVTAVPTPTNDTTPSYTFSSDEAGSITYGGSCSSATTAAVVRNNTITFNALEDGTYNDCTITVTDAATNVSTPLAVTAFVVDTTVPDETPPTLAEVTAVPTPTNDTTPSYTFSSDEAGSITYGGSCSSATTAAVVGNNTITFNALEDGTYNDCTITVTDAANNVSTPLAVTVFVVDTTVPALTEVIAVPTPTNDTTPSYTFSSDEAGTIAYVGDCTSTTTAAIVGNNTITFNTLAEGTHSNCTITVTDAANNVSTPLAVTVFVVDTTIPVISLTGASPQVIEVGTVYTELNAIASDNVDSDITANIVIDASAVNTEEVGNYTVTYNVKDAAGNDADTVTRTVYITNVVSLLKTGQTKSYDENGTEVGNDTVGDGLLKDNGYYQKGINPDFVRDDVDEIVIDNLMNQMWQDDADAGSIQKPWLTADKFDTCDNDSNESYASPACHDVLNDNTAVRYCDNLTLGGYSDWRLPTRRELANILDYGEVWPTIDETVFKNIKADGWYWSSTSYEGHILASWRVSFFRGIVDFKSKADSYYVRCVRDE